MSPPLLSNILHFLRGSYHLLHYFEKIDSVKGSFQEKPNLLPCSPCTAAVLSKNHETSIHDTNHKSWKGLEKNGEGRKWGQSNGSVSKGDCHRSVVTYVGSPGPCEDERREPTRQSYPLTSDLCSVALAQTSSSPMSSLYCNKMDYLA